MEQTGRYPNGFYVIARQMFHQTRDKLLFTHLVEQANYKDSANCRRGQLITSAKKLSKETEWSEDKIRVSLDRLEASEMISRQTFTDRKKGTVITIIGYDEMQSLKSYKNPELIPKFNTELDDYKMLIGTSDEVAFDNENPELNKKLNPDSLTSFETAIKNSSKKGEKGIAINSNTTYSFFLDEYDFQSEDIETILNAYYRSYEHRFGENHPKLKREQLKRIYDQISEFLAEMDWVGVEVEQAYELVEKYFETPFANCDYKLNHFASVEILKNRYYETLY